MKKKRKIASQILLFTLIQYSVDAFPAADREILKDIVKLTDGSQNLQRSSVYVYGDPSLDTLIPVRVLGAVGKAGLHFVPADTDLVTLLSLAGGISDKAITDKVTIKRLTKGQYEIIGVNLEDLLQESQSESPKLKSNDTILVPQEKSIVSDNTLRVASLVTAFATVFTSVLLAVKR